MLLGNGVELLGFVLLGRILLYFIVIADVVGVTFANAFGVTY